MQYHYPVHTRSGVVACYNISTLCAAVDDDFMIFATFAVCACCLCQKNQRFELYILLCPGYVFKLQGLCRLASVLQAFR